MAKKRVHELAKELNISNKELIEFLNSKGYEIKSHMSSVPEDSIKQVTEHFKGTKAEAKPKAKKEQSKKTAAKKKGAEKKEETKKPSKPAKKAEKKDKKPKGEVEKVKAKAVKKEEKEVKKAKKVEKKPEAKPKPKKEAKKEIKEEKPVAKKKEEKKYEPGELGIIELSEFTTVRQLAAKIGRKTKEIMAKLKEKGVNAGANQMIDFNLIEEIAGEFGYLVDKIPYEHEALVELEKPDPEDKLKERPPIVTLMGMLTTVKHLCLIK